MTLMVSDGSDGLNECSVNYKEKGNELFKNGRYMEAIEMYTKAIEIDGNVSCYYTNRSFCHIKLESYGAAITDANKSIELDNRFIKAYYRRASAFLALGKIKAAQKDLEFVVKVYPNDMDARNKLTECKKQYEKQLFAGTFDVFSNKSVLESIDVSKIEVEASYDGPILQNSKVDLEFVESLKVHLKNQKKLHKKFLYEIIKQIINYFKQCKSLVYINLPEDSPMTVCGDVHGQFYDLLNIFEINGSPSETNPYLFNGDFVDRGSFSCEVIVLIFSYKLLYPNHFFLARGNHESNSMNQMYGFESEIKSKYSADMYEAFSEAYCWLPLAHCIKNKVLAVHGGLFTKEDVKLADIEKIDRNRQPPEEGLMCDILWSDPQAENGRAPSKRGSAIQFGPDVTKTFCEQNNLLYIIRSHEVKPEGYEVAHNNMCITVFSAPNYCDQMGNKGAFIRLDDITKPKYVTFDAVPHPNVSPMAYRNSMASLFGLM